MARLHGAPDLNRPFLTTMEMFRVKLSTDRTLASRFGAADASARRAMLADGGEVGAARVDLALARSWATPTEIERVEWFASVEECARAMAELRAAWERPGMAPVRQALTRNPGLGFDGARWPTVAYKGGSEPGVLNMTWLLERADGRVFALSIGWCNPRGPVDVGGLAGPVSAAVHHLARR